MTNRLKIKKSLDDLKMETAQELGINLNKKYAGTLNSKGDNYKTEQIIEVYENGLKD